MKRISILLGIVVALGVLALYRRWDTLFTEGDPHRQSSRTEKVSPLPAIDRTLVQAIELDDGKEKVRVQRSGEAWVLPDCFDHPATEDRIKQLFEALVDLDKAEPVGASPKMHHLYEVDDGGKGKRLKLEGSGGTVIADLVIGKQDLSGGRQAMNARTFIRPAGSNQVYLHAGRMAHLMYTMKRVWLDSRLVPQDYTEIQKLLDQATKLVVEYDDVELGAVPAPGAPPVEHTGQRQRLVLECRQVPVEKKPDAAVGPEPTPPSGQEKKDTERKWFFTEPESAKALDCYLPLVDGLIRQFLGGRFEEVRGKDPALPEFGLEKPVVELTVSFQDGTARRLRIGALVPPAEGATPQPGTSQRFGHLEGRPFVVGIPEYMARSFQKKPEELKVPAEQAGAPPAAAPGQEIAIPPEEGGDQKPPAPEKKDPTPEQKPGGQGKG